jgi:hypothetical protein
MLRAEDGAPDSANADTTFNTRRHDPRTGSFDFVCAALCGSRSHVPACAGVTPVGPMIANRDYFPCSATCRHFICF